MRIDKYDQDNLIFSSGDPADAFFVILQGSIKLFVLSHDGSETIIEIIEEGMSFAEAAMFALASYPVNCEAMEGTRLLRIERSDFLNKLQQNRQLPLQILASLGRWQLRLMGELWQLKAQTPAQRLAWLLVTLSGSNSGRVRIRLPYPKSAIAGRIGIAQESLSRAFTRLTAQGVETHANHVTIADVDKLRRFCGH